MPEASQYLHCPVCGFPYRKNDSECKSCHAFLKFFEKIDLAGPEVTPQKAVAKALCAAKPFRTQGQYEGAVLLTPEIVSRYQSLDVPKGQPVYEHKINITHVKNGEWIYVFDWNNKSDPKRLRTRTISYSPLLPLGFCCACMNPATHYEVAQTLTCKDTIRFSIEGANQFTADQIAIAWGCDRDWIPVPFCNQHSLTGHHHPIQINKDENHYTVRVTNSGYSQLIEKQYQTPARTYTPADRLKTWGVSLLGLFSLLLTLNYGIPLIGYLTQPAPGDASSTVEKILLTALGIILGIIALVWWRKKPTPSSTSLPRVAAQSAPPPLAKATITPVAPSLAVEKKTVEPAVDPDPIATAITQLERFSKSDFGMLPILEKLGQSKDPRVVAPLVRVMFSAANDYDSIYANSYPACGPVLQATFQALLHLGGTESTTALEKIYRERIQEEKRIPLVRLMGTPLNDQAVRWLFEIPGFSFRNPSTKTGELIQSYLVAITRKDPTPVSAYLNSKIHIYKEIAQQVLDQSENDNIMDILLPFMHGIQLEPLEQELGLIQTEYHASSKIFAALGCLPVRGQKASLALDSLRQSAAINELIRLSQHTKPVIRDIAANLLVALDEAQAVEPLAGLFQSQPSATTAFILSHLLNKPGDATAIEKLKSLFQLHPTESMASILKELLSEIDFQEFISTGMEKLFLEKPTLETALSLCTLHNPLPVSFLLEALLLENNPLKYVGNDKEQKSANMAFTERARLKYEALLSILQHNPGAIAESDLTRIVHCTDLEFTSVYSYFIDYEAMNSKVTEKFDLSALRKLAQAELDRRAA